MCLCQLLVASLEINMDLLIGMSEESAENCEEALEGVQLLMVGTLYSVCLYVFPVCVCVCARPCMHACVCLSVFQVVFVSLPLQSFTALPGSYPVNERCSDLTFSFWEKFLVCYSFSVINTHCHAF